MLVNEIYIGNMVQGKYGSISYKTKQNKPRPKDTWYRVEGTHEAIIDRELWNRVQDLVAERVKPFDTGNVGILRGKYIVQAAAISCDPPKTAVNIICSVQTVMFLRIPVKVHLFLLQSWSKSYWVN